MELLNTNDSIQKIIIKINEIVSNLNQLETDLAKEISKIRQESLK